MSFPARRSEPSQSPGRCSPGTADLPLETADLIGLDTVLRSIEVIHAEFNDDKYRPCPLLRKMVYAGMMGRKSGKGFYDYGAA